MLMTEIKRDVLPVLSGISEDVFTLAKDAESVLGYPLLRESLENDPDVPTLRAALGTLGIEVLNKEDVFAYMRERSIERTRELLEVWAVGDFNPQRSWNRMEGAYWDSTEIAKYKEAVPEFVVNKAVQIKRALPEAELYIVHLTEARDPFLKVTFGDVNEWDETKGETYFIEVWDEPRFEGRI